MMLQHLEPMEVRLQVLKEPRDLVIVGRHGVRSLTGVSDKTKKKKQGTGSYRTLMR
jgi:hypothetical protein